MEIVKNNIVSIILGLIAVVALTTPFWLVGSYADQLQARAEASKRSGTELSALLTKSRTKPAPTPDGQPEPLTEFPNQPTIEAGQKLRDRVTETATGMVRQAVEMNRRQPLVPDALPRPRNLGDLAFRDRYLDTAKPKRITQDLLKGGTPPTAEEIKVEQDKLGQQFAQGVAGVRGQAGMNNQQQLQEEFRIEAAKVPARLTADRARQIRMFVDPNALTWHPGIQPGGAVPTPTQIWFAQLGLWIQENVAEAIVDSNHDARDVTDAVVKHLVRIEFAENPYLLPTSENPATGGSPGGRTGPPEGWNAFGPGGPPGSGGPMGPGGPGSMGPRGADMGASSAAADVPVAMPDETQPLPTQFARSITGRVSNALFDVVHFRLVAVVDARRLPIFLQALGDNRFMYVRQMNVQAVDAAAQQLSGYIYGDDPVVQLTLDMEMLFMRRWTMDFMPDPVRISLGIPPHSTAQPAVPTE